MDDLLVPVLDQLQVPPAPMTLSVDTHWSIVTDTQHVCSPSGARIWPTPWLARCDTITLATPNRYYLLPPPPPPQEAPQVRPATDFACVWCADVSDFGLAMSVYVTRPPRRF